MCVCCIQLSSLLEAEHKLSSHNSSLQLFLYFPLFSPLPALQAVGFCTFSIAWDDAPNINNMQLHIEKKKLPLPPFQMSFKKGKAFTA